MGGGVRSCSVRGPLAPLGAGFDEWLLGRGFSRWTVRQRVGLFAVLSGWLEREGLGAGDLDEARAGLFVAARRRAGLRSWVSPRCVALPLEYLREVGAVPPPVPMVAVGPVEVLLEGYREYLLVERGLARSTVVRYECIAGVSRAAAGRA
jgi:integrase/recombinase XerD